MDINDSLKRDIVQAGIPANVAVVDENTISMCINKARLWFIKIYVSQ